MLSRRIHRMILFFALLIGAAGMNYVQAANVTLTLTASPAAGGRVKLPSGTWSTASNGTVSQSVVSGKALQIQAEAFSGYTFSKWSDNNTNATRGIQITSNKTYTAYFTPNKVTLTLKTATGNTTQGTVRFAGETAGASVSKTFNYNQGVNIIATPATGYHFVQWSDGNTNANRTVYATSATTYTATFAINTYTITFKNDDGTTLKTQTVNYNVKPTPPSNPTKAATAQYTYTFKGWDKTIVAATANATYTATYTSTVRSYTIRFLNGSTVLQTNTLQYGATPSYTGSNPTKASTAQYSYTFNGWSPAIYAVNKAQDYTAQFKSTVRSYKITGASSNTSMGTVTGGGTYNYGSSAKLTATPTSNCYEFVQWTDGVTDNPRTVTVTGAKTYTATFGVAIHGYCGAMVDSKTGTNLTWTLDKCTGRLTISGTGEMRQYCSYWTAENWWGNNNYYSNNIVITVIVGNGVTSIGDCAFWWQKNSLTSVTLPNTLTYIGEAFRGCSSLVSINLPNSLTFIDEEAFAYCTSLTSVTIPNKLTEISEGLFAHCTSLASVTIPNSVTTIGEYAFQDCALTSVTIPKSVTSIGKSAFKNNEGLTDIYVSWTSASELPAYPENMVSSPSAITLHIPCGTGDMYRAASGWSQFKIVGNTQYTLKATSPSSAQGTVSIDDGTAGTSLSKKDYCETIHTISATPAGCYVFTKWSDGNTDNPRTVTLNSNVTYTAQFANSISGTCGANGNNLTWSLDNCTGVLTISGSGAMKDYERTGDNCTDYSSSAPWIEYKESITSIVLPYGLTRIGNYAFYQCRGVTDIDLPAALLSIGNYAFAETGLQQVCVPEGVTTIGGSAFSNMCFSSNSTPLKRVYLPNSLTSIGAYAISYNPLKFLTYPASANSFTTPYRGAYPANEVYASWKTDIPQRQGRVESIGSPKRKMHIPYGTTALYRAKDWAYIYQLVEDVDERAIDLGLSIRWASCNVGATAPEENGDFYAWGDTLTRSSFTWGTYPYSGTSTNTMTKYCTRAANGTVDNRSTLIAFDDAAYINWGETWRMPTWTEWNELITQCTWKDTTINNVSVWQVTGPNGNSLYLPKVGYKNNSSVTAGCYYWSSTLNTTNSNDQCNRALYVNAADRSGAKYGLRYVGMPIRAVYRREWPSFTLTITDTPESTAYTKAVNAGSSYTLTAQEDDCHHFVRWADGNTQNPRTVTVSADATYTAVYDTEQFTVTVQAEDPTMGDVSITVEP